MSNTILSILERLAKCEKCRYGDCPSCKQQYYDVPQALAKIEGMVVPTTEKIEKLLGKWGEDNNAISKELGFRHKLATAIHAMLKGRIR
jgi:hypothetical protein